MEEILQLFRDLVKQALNFEDDRVLLENFTRPRPTDNKPYVTLSVINIERYSNVNGDNVLQEDVVETLEHVSTANLVTLRVTVHGKNAFFLAQNLRDFFDSNARFFDTWNRVGFSNMTGVQDTSFMFGAQIYQRAHLDLSFYAYLNAAFEPEWFTRTIIETNTDSEIYPKEFEACHK